MGSAKRWWWIAGGGAAVAAILWILRPTALVVDVDTVTRGGLTITIDEEGETRVRDRFVVAAPITGKLRRITVEAGDSVRPGTPVAMIDPSPLDPRTRRELTARLEAAMDSERMARTEVSQAREALEQAQREHARIESLFQRNVVAPELRERAALTETSRRRDLEAADFRAQAAAHDAEQARAALLSADRGSTTIRSPISGKVLRVVEPSERIVGAGTPILELGDPRRLEIVAEVLSTDAIRIAPGDTIRVIGWGGPDSLVALVRRIEPSGFTKISALGVEEHRVNVVGTIVGPPPALGDRYRADVKIVVWRGTDLLRIQRSALFRVGESWRAFTLTGGRARERTVSIGRQGLDIAEVLDGLSEGDSVILQPDERIGDGTRVTPRPPTAP
jgi:HlyD family secretion protein